MKTCTLFLKHEITWERRTTQQEVVPDSLVKSMKQLYHITCKIVHGILAYITRSRDTMPSNRSIRSSIKLLFEI